MSATDELRRLLDKRGVEHSGNDANVTHWLNYAAVATEQPGKVLWLSYYVTPEEAVNITLGRGECEYSIKDNMSETEGMGDVWIECSACHCAFDYYADEWLMNMHYCPNCGAKVVEQ